MKQLVIKNFFFCRLAKSSLLGSASIFPWATVRSKTVTSLITVGIMAVTAVFWW